MAIHRRFPIIDCSCLPLSKAKKRKDMERMLTSPNSEDWVSWTMMRALQRRETAEWWPEIVSLASRCGADTEFLCSSLPNVDLWRSVDSPQEYEQASRARMARSNNPEWKQRARNPRPVEGKTEVDIVFESPEYLVFVEAKLLSSISERTTYDPDRNQILRNIDCVIEEASGRKPYFWMFVKDCDPQHQGSNSILYSDLIQHYRSDLKGLIDKLPHRDSDTLAHIVRGIAVIEWRNLIPTLPDMPNETDVLTELRDRVGATA